MSSDRPAAPTTTPRRAARPDPRRRQRRAQAHRARGRPALDGGGARHGSARRPDPPGLLLRHAGPGAQPRRASWSARGACRARATTPSSSSARSSRRAARRAAPVARASASRSTRCRAASSAPASLKGVAGGGAVKASVERRRGRCASCSPRSSAPSTPSTRPTASSSTTSSVLGPIFVLKLKFTPKDFAASSSRRCGSTPTTRASSSCRPSACPAEAFQTVAETRAFLARHGVDLTGEQQTKTRARARVLQRQDGRGVAGAVSGRSRRRRSDRGRRAAAKTSASRASRSRSSRASARAMIWRRPAEVLVVARGDVVADHDPALVLAFAAAQRDQPVGIAEVRPGERADERRVALRTHVQPRSRDDVPRPRRAAAASPAAEHQRPASCAVAMREASCPDASAQQGKPPDRRWCCHHCRGSDAHDPQSR